MKKKISPLAAIIFCFSLTLFILPLSANAPDEKPVSGFHLHISGDGAAGTLILGQGAYQAGEEVPLQVQTPKGFAFRGWKLNGTLISEKEHIRFVMPDMDVELVAHLEVVPTYMLTLDGDQACLNLPAAGIYHPGEEVILTANVPQGYSFGSWKLNGLMISKQENIRFIMPDMDVDLKVEMIPEPGSHPMGAAYAANSCRASGIPWEEEAAD